MVPSYSWMLKVFSVVVVKCHCIFGPSYNLIQTPTRRRKLAVLGCPKIQEPSGSLPPIAAGRSPVTAKIQPNSCRLLHPPQSLTEWKLAAIRWELLTAFKGKGFFPWPWLIVEKCWVRWKFHAFLRSPKTVGGAVGLNGTTLLSEFRNSENPSTSRNSHRGETQKFTT